MATARKLKSGNWNCRVYDQYSNKQISFTAETKKEAERQAALYKLTLKPHEESSMTLSDAIDTYIDNRKSVLSVTTYVTYTRYKKYYGSLLPIRLDAISDAMLQKWVDSITPGRTPKSVRNIYSLITAVYASYLPSRRLFVRLPKKVRPQIEIPSEAEIKHLLVLSKGTVLEIPVLLAVFCTMRRGEICALTTEDIDYAKRTIHVHGSMAKGIGKGFVRKSPKSYAGDRYISCPQNVLDALKKGLPDITPTIITNQFRRLQQNNGLKVYRFHDLRHYSASMKHELGIPTVEIMRQGGWESERVLNEIYRHSISESAQKADDIWSRYSASLVTN